MKLKKLETLQASLEKYSKKKVEHLLGKDRLQDTYNESAYESTIQDREKAEGSTDLCEKNNLSVGVHRNTFRITINRSLCRNGTGIEVKGRAG